MKTSLRAIYNSVPYLSIKYDTYFTVYEALLQKYVGRRVTVVEVGVFNGGSLFMWREFFGPKARIIGIDLNPATKMWEQHGFEIYIGDQTSEQFWREFFAEVGSVDVVIDDGGHTNVQQITTVHCAIEHIHDGGTLIVEDVHTSYFREYGNPSSRSFINFTAKIIDAINSRSTALKTSRPRYSKRVHHISFYESIVALHIESTLCGKSAPTSNDGNTQNALDFRYQQPLPLWLFKVKNRAAINSSGGSKFYTKVLIRTCDYLLMILSRLDGTRNMKFWRHDVQ